MPNYLTGVVRVLDGCTPGPAFADRPGAADGHRRGQTLGALPRELSGRHGARTALVDGARRVSYAQLDVRADRLAAGLHGLGIRAADRVIVQLPNVPEFVTVMFALFRLGAVPVFALPSHRHEEIVHLAERSGAVAYVIPDRHAGFDHRALAVRLVRARPTVRHVLVAGGPDGWRGAGPFTALNEVGGEPLDLPGSDPGGIAFWQPSGDPSGAAGSGDPSGAAGSGELSGAAGSGGLAGTSLIARTHDDYVGRVRAAADDFELGPDTVYLCALPAALHLPLGSPGVLGTLNAGGTVVLAPRPAPEAAFPLIEAEGVTVTALTAPLATAWLDAAAANRDREGAPVLSSLRLLQVGGAPLSEEAARRVRSLLGCALRPADGPGTRAAVPGPRAAGPGTP